MPGTRRPRRPIRASAYEPLYRAGEITKADLTAKRALWIERERLRVSEGRAARDPWTVWAAVYGSFAETRDEAIEALSNLPRDDARPRPGRSLTTDFAIAKTYALVGRWDDVMPYLARVVGTCATLDEALVIAKARLLLAQAQEAKGDLAAAKQTYEKIVDAWPKTTSSKTWKRASDRLAALR